MTQEYQQIAYAINLDDNFRSGPDACLEDSMKPFTSTIPLDSDELVSDVLFMRRKLR